ncbi:MAG: UDP-N-acetylglucosamine 2-epimerase [Xanthomonadales bacterium]|nr:UDP-N-acetylglucosamine 2-epimerase [Xanthomonadales bacterium]
MPLSHSTPLLIVAGTRPEALKLLPLAEALTLPAIWCWTGQQGNKPPECLHLPWHELPPPAHPLRRRQLEQTLIEHLLAFMLQHRPQAVLVQGDTVSAYAGARAAEQLGLPLIHLEAGLRSGDLRSPFPEEAYRRLISRLARWHLAPSTRAAAQLRCEGVASAQIHVVGSTAVDGLRVRPLPPASDSYHLLVDVHRRENAGRALDRLALGLRALARSGWRIGVCAHPNRSWEQRWSQALGPNHGLKRLPPQNREQWLALAQSARGVLSDSGGAAEELPYLGVPLLLYRRRSERPESLESGHARWLDPRAVGDLDGVIERALDQGRWPAAWPLSVDSPYGDGRAGARAAAAIHACLGLRPNRSVTQPQLQSA